MKTVACITLLGLACGHAQAAQPGLCAGAIPTCVGSNVAEQIQGTPGPDVILAQGGNDKIVTLAGNDKVCAGLEMTT